MERSSTLISKSPEIGHLPYSKPGSAKAPEQNQDWLTVGLLAHLVLLLVLLVAFQERILAAILMEHGFLILAGGVLFLGSAPRVGKLFLVLGTLPLVPALPLVLSMFLGR